jgi:hypothetical protein
MEDIRTNTATNVPDISTVIHTNINTNINIQVNTAMAIIIITENIPMKEVTKRLLRGLQH